jgi:hypothetical protein
MMFGDWQLRMSVIGSNLQLDLDISAFGSIWKVS